MKIFKRSVIILMLLSFLVVFFTGVIRLPETQRYFLFVYNYISASSLAFYHDWSGIVFVFLIIIHLIFERRWFNVILQSNKVIPEKVAKIIYVIAVVVVLGLATVFLISHWPRHVTDLSKVEVKEYQGEKLGSISDFRENSIKGVQHIDRQKYKLEVTGLVDQSKSYSYAELLKLPAYQKVVELNCVEGWSVKALWKGILVKDILKGVSIKPEARTIIFYAADGYSTSFPLEYVLNNNIIMADNLNGVELPPERGFPFQLVAEQKWGYKWIKWITKIELSDNTNYKGFWESAGYNNKGDLSGSKFENK